ncbi:hypothetical protein ARMSODRAFT_976853 [Armillaria solidipes]|uniref:Uncharacterized protein n=1 Tax=Armillaria solidipes TaxID=1076256 RepID=A0A2H3BBU6_9AGAR|nr:hypothetical protein ARMSODRAFT_976853 [Armillaria solidipes]
MTLYSSKGGVETYYFHYTSHSDIPVEAICWNEGEARGYWNVGPAHRAAIFMQSYNIECSRCMHKEKEEDLKSVRRYEEDRRCVVRCCLDAGERIGRQLKAIETLQGRSRRGEEDQPIEIPSTTDDTTNTMDYLIEQARGLIKNFEGDTPKWLTTLGGPSIVVAILSSILDYAPNLLRQQNYHCPITDTVELGQPKLPSEWMGTLGIFHILQRPQVINSRRNTQIDFFGPITREIIQNYIGTVMDLDSVPDDDSSNAIALELNTCSHLSDFRMSLKATGRYGDVLGNSEWQKTSGRK